MVCHGCKFVAQCEPAHQVAQQILRDRFGIKTTQQLVTARKEKQRAINQDVETQDDGFLAVPQKVRELLERIDRGQLDILGKLKNGINPFGSGLKFMAITCHLLINGSITINKKNLAEIFVKKLDWQDNTAEAHARMAIQALTHVGAVDNSDGIITLRRS